MLRVLIAPTTFDISESMVGQNPFIHAHSKIDKKVATEEHKKLAKALPKSIVYTIPTDETSASAPDIVFAANGGLSLPNLPERVFILPNMKYPQRRAELPYLKSIVDNLGLQTIYFPISAVFEGQAEAKWFHGGKLLVCGYGHRATKQSFVILNKMLRDIYTYYGKEPPTLLTLPIRSAKFFHLDAAMLEYDDSKCIVHKRAFSPESLSKLKHALSAENVTVLDTTDDFCLNAIVNNSTLITHKIADPKVGPLLESLTGRKIHSVDTSQFEAAGGSARCMVLDIHPIK
jgi:N-dimethylarginine dimethylaminohydrolase